MRRDVYLKLAGFPKFFRPHGYEEPDYALQCYAAGFAVWFEPNLAVRHHMSSVNRPRGPAPASARQERAVERADPLPLAVSAGRGPVPHLAAAALRRQTGPFGCAAAARLVAVGPARPAAVPHGPGRAPLGRTYWAWMKLARNPVDRPLDLARAMGATR